jgi:tryptophanyl-tRNA synthetase
LSGDEKQDTCFKYFFALSSFVSFVRSGEREGLIAVISNSNHLPLQLTVMTENTIDTKEAPVSSRPRVLSGMRPTGRLHLGNYMGALYNWVQLQHQYECYFFIADYHALTTDYADTSGLKDNIREVALDFLAAGLDPAKCTIFIQSDVKAHFELHALLSMITPLSWLERVPSYKDQQEQLREKDLATYGFLGYPLLQSADILVYQPSFVPVGQDQAAHVELTREVARRFNQFYPGAFYLASDAAAWEMPAIEEKARKLADDKTKTIFSPHQLFEAAQQAKLKSAYGVIEVLPEPQVLLTPSPKLPGTDGRKMSKSYKNTILLSDPEAEVRAKLKTMVTDPARIRRDDPGNPDICPVFDLHKVFSTEDTQQRVREGCTTAGIGCIECKGWLADGVVQELAPIQERRRYFEANADEVDAILADGSMRAAARAAVTMGQVRRAVGLE